MAKNKQPKREIREEVDLLSTMIESLVELLEKKGILTQAEWEKQVKQRINV